MRRYPESPDPPPPPSFCGLGTKGPEAPLLLLLLLLVLTPKLARTIAFLLTLVTTLARTLPAEFILIPRVTNESFLPAYIPARLGMPLTALLIRRRVLEGANCSVPDGIASMPLPLKAHTAMPVAKFGPSPRLLPPVDTIILQAIIPDLAAVLNCIRAICFLKALLGHVLMANDMCRLLRILLTLVLLMLVIIRTLARLRVTTNSAGAATDEVMARFLLILPDRTALPTGEQTTVQFRPARVPVIDRLLTAIRVIVPLQPSPVALHLLVSMRFPLQSDPQ